ncbi:hypothetical protein ABZV34_06805 [Streptomyces sp. NPDC005195]|uniref:hypothetical protein n=1 Tax=Streptomyces sp. NPDC005195 TaxID=3154561 RepID=UPI0033B65943
MSAEAQRLREIFAEATCDVTPTPVPLAAVERAARRRRRRRAAAVVGFACASLMVPAAAVALRAGADTTRVTGPSAGPRGTVRVVTPGERVRIASGIKIWLTEDGGHWNSPWSTAPRFRGVKDDGIDIGTPGVTLQEEGACANGYFVSGMYHGKGDAARVRIETTAGDVDGTALTLAGSPHWGVWYAVVKSPKTQKTQETQETPKAQEVPGTSMKRRVHDGPTRRVTVYDSAGRVIATMEFAT